jgi:hypothetical protein
MKSYIFSTLFLLACGCVLFYQAFHITPGDIQAVRETIENLESPPKAQNFSVKQQRQCVHRTLIPFEETSTPYFFESSTSTLLFTKNGTENKIIEEMTGFKGWLIEKSQDDTQNPLIREIVAKQALVSPQEGLLKAVDVSSQAFYSQAFPPKDTLHTASPFHVHFKAGELEYHEHQCNLTKGIDLIHPMGRLLAEKAKIFLKDQNFSNDSLKHVEVRKNVQIFPCSGGTLRCACLDLDSLHKTCFLWGYPSVSYEGEGGIVFSKEAEMKFQDNDWTLKELVMTYQVKWISTTQKQFALADRVHYDPFTEKTVLEAFPGNKVLFVDLEKEVELAASKVIAEKDAYGVDQFSGSGAVRMRFNLEEWEQIKREIHNEIPKFAKGL